MMELFKHILHLDFEWLFQNYGTLVYLILFLVIFIETGLVIMPFLPGDSLLFTAGLFARLGYLNIAYLLILLFIAAVIGDNTNYWVGRKIGLRVLQLKWKNKKIVKQEYLDKTHTFYEKYGTKTIIMARFVPIVRTFAPFTAGMNTSTIKSSFLKASKRVPTYPAEKPFYMLHLSIPFIVPITNTGFPSSSM